LSAPEESIAFRKTVFKVKSMVTEFTPRQAFMILNALPHIGPITLNRLLDTFGQDPVAVLKAGARELGAVKGVGRVMVETLREWSKHYNLEKEEAMLEKTGVTFVTCQDPEYPPILKEIHDPPIGLYRKGKYSEPRPSIAIVGSRRTTLYGQAMAKKLATELGRAGFCIVSGLARGIDTHAHEGALEVEGNTVAVLGCGLDIIYPPENLDLYRKIEAAGAIYSEFPFGRRADRQSFPMRNRIVAGLSDAVIVVESDVSGGSMITARFAGEQGRVLFAVPGRVDQSSSAGCHQLIRDGAILCRGVEDVLEELNYLQGMRPIAVQVEPGGVSSRLGELPEEEATILRHLDNGEALSIDQLAGLMAKPSHELSSLLVMLELKRLVVKKVDGRFEATM
jgi:DNA processing protein